MRIYRLAAFLGMILAGSFIFADFPALAATPSFAVAASGVTLSSSSSSGEGSSTITLTSINGYAGSIIVNCIPPTPPAGVKVPFCGPGYPSAATPEISAAAPAISAAAPAIVALFTLTAGGAVNGTVAFYNFPFPVSANLPRRPSHGFEQGLALAGAFLIGFGFRRRAPRWLAMMLFALGTLASLAGISACGANNSAVTPGTCAYTISATDNNTGATVNTSINVMVP